MFDFDHIFGLSGLKKRAIFICHYKSDMCTDTQVWVQIPNFFGYWYPGMGANTQYFRVSVPIPTPGYEYPKKFGIRTHTRGSIPNFLGYRYPGMGMRTQFFGYRYLGMGANTQFFWVLVPRGGYGYRVSVPIPGLSKS